MFILLGESISPSSLQRFLSLRYPGLVNEQRMGEVINRLQTDLIPLPTLPKIGRPPVLIPLPSLPPVVVDEPITTLPDHLLRPLNPVRSLPPALADEIHRLQSDLIPLPERGRPPRP